MPPKLPREEIAELMNFVAEKARKTDTLLSARQVSEQFIAATGSLLTRESVRNRIRNARKRIHRMDEFDEETKVRLLFVLSAQVDADFLIQLQKNANVEVDEYQRITRYKSRGGLLLEGIHMKLKPDNTSLDDSPFSSPTTAQAMIPSTSNSGRKRQTKRRKRKSETPSEKRSRVPSAEVSEHEALEDSGWSDIEDNADEGGEGYQQPAGGRVHEEYVIEKEEYVDDELPNRQDEMEERLLMVPKAEADAFEIHPDASEDTHTSVKELLILLRGAVLSVESPRLTNLVEKMNLKIRKSEKENKRFDLENINIPFDACLFLLTNNVVPKSPEECISLRDFLISLKSVTAHINHQSIYAYHQKLRTLVLELFARDKQIPVKIVHHAIEATLIIIAP